MKLPRTKKFNVCGACGNPKNLSRYALVTKCRYCGFKGLHRIQLVDKSNLYRLNGKRAKILINKAKQEYRHLGIDVPTLLRKALYEPTETEFSNLWFTQVITKSNTYHLWHKGCILHNPPKRVVKELMKKKMMQIRIPVDLHRWFKRYALEHDMSMTEVLLRYIYRLQAHQTRTLEPEQI